MRTLAVADPPVLAVADPNQATATLADFYQRMVLIRATERALLDLYARGRLPGVAHTCIGQEAVAVGVMAALDRRADAVLSDHRGIGHFLAFREDVRGLIAEVMGKAEGVCGGISGSQHLHAGDFHADGTPGGTPPMAAEIATAMRQRNQRAVTVLFHGDGATDEGAIAETLNIAAHRHLPLLVVIARDASRSAAPETAGNRARRGDADRIPRIAIDGNDVMAVYDTASRAVAAIRASNGPRILVCNTPRPCPDSTRDDGRDPHDPLNLAAAGLDAVWCRVTRAVIAAEVAAILAELAAC